MRVGSRESSRCCQDDIIFYTYSIQMPSLMCLAFSNPSKLGGGVPGAQPPSGLIGGGGGPDGGSGMSGGSGRAMSRRILREAFGNGCMFKNMPFAASLGGNFRTGPFRMATNSGDPNGTTNAHPSPHLPQVNGVGGIQGVLSRSRMTVGGVHNNEDAYYSGNPKYVYDSSNYTTFRKRQAINRTYNNKSFGGDQSSAAQVALAHVRH